MGVTSSSPFVKIKEWSWGRVLSIIQNYRTERYGFVLDKETAAKVTGLDVNDIEKIAEYIPHEAVESGCINVISLLISLILAVETSTQPNSLERVRAIFNVFDFGCKGRIHIDEMTILLLMLSNACNAVIGIRQEFPEFSVVSKMTAQAFESLDRRSNSYIKKEDFILWAHDVIELLPKVDCWTIATSIREGVHVPPKKKTKRRKSKPHEQVQRPKTTSTMTYNAEAFYALKRSLNMNTLVILPDGVRAKNETEEQLSDLTYSIELEDFHDNYVFFISQDKDLYVLKKSLCLSGQSELYVYSFISKYQDLSLSCETIIKETSDEVNFLLASNNDLIVIETQHTSSYHIELRMLSAASQYQQCFLETITPLPETTEKLYFLHGSKSNDDIFVITAANEETKSIEIIILDRETNYKTVAAQFRSCPIPNITVDEIQYTYLLDEKRNIVIIRSPKSYIVDKESFEDITTLCFVTILLADTDYETMLEIERDNILPFEHEAAADLTPQMTYINACGSQGCFPLTEKSDDSLSFTL